MISVGHSTISERMVPSIAKKETHNRNLPDLLRTLGECKKGGGGVNQTGYSQLFVYNVDLIYKVYNYNFK